VPELPHSMAVGTGEEEEEHSAFVNDVQKSHSVLSFAL
jgi:hypothetical protein